MSDPVTNVEIEDVLSSIRKLVSDGDKARTRDPAPVEVTDQEPEHEAEEAVDVAESKPEKLVLSPAFMVVASQDDDETAEASAPEPLNLSDPVWEDTDAHDQHDEIEADDASPDVAEDSADEDTIDDDVETATDDAAQVQGVDRSNLVETIAELEAAVSTDTQDYEPDGSEDLGETIAWPGAMMRQPQVVEDAQPADDVEPETSADIEPSSDDDYDNDALDNDPPSFTHREDAANDDAPDGDAPDSAEAADVFEDDDLDDLLEAGGVTLDEAALRELVSEVVREELTGPLGERITRNVRKLVRREIYRILSSQEFD